MLRRTKTQELDGRAMLDIPPVTVNKVEMEFSVEERDLYESLFKSSITRYNKFVNSGSFFIQNLFFEMTLILTVLGMLLRQYTQVTALLMRLKQAACHPYLVVNSVSCALKLG